MILSSFSNLLKNLGLSPRSPLQRRLRPPVLAGLLAFTGVRDDKFFDNPC